jgi:hypothetical protein
VWLVQGLPPEPWPNLSAEALPVDVGPPWTCWFFDNTALAARYAFSIAVDPVAFNHGTSVYTAPELLPGKVDYIYYTEPGKGPQMTIDVLRGTVHGKVGTLEECCNVLHYITNPEVAITPAIVATFGDKLAAAWGDFLLADTFIDANGLDVAQYLARSVTYDEVRAAHVQIVGDTVKWAAGTQTYYAPLGGNSGQGDSLPAQVACTVTFHTGVRAGKRGRSGRGRAYLGPLGAKSINTLTGLFATGFAEAIATQFKAHLMVGMNTGPNPFQLVVLSPATNARYLVQDILVGHVPDTQRRRRKSLIETPFTAA